MKNVKKFQEMTTMEQEISQILHIIKIITNSLV